MERATPPLPGGLIVALYLGMIVTSITVWFQIQPESIGGDMIQHVVWYRQYLPHNPLPVDTISSFFLAMNTAAYRAAYRIPAEMGIDPVMLGLIFGFVATILAALGAAAWIRRLDGSIHSAAAAAILMLLFLAFRDDMTSGSARMFGWPALTWSLWALTAGRPLAFAIITAAGAALYPPALVVALTVVGLDRIGQALRRRAIVRADFVWALACMPAFVLMLMDSMQPSAWGPMIDGTAGRLRPELWVNGRTAFFNDNPILYYLFDSGRSGLFSKRLYDVVPVLLLAIYGLTMLRNPARRVLRWQLMMLAIASVLLWAAAHATLFRLYLPARYPNYGLGCCMVALASISLAHIAGASDRARRQTIAVLLIAPVLLLTTTHIAKFGITSATAPGLLAALRGDKRPGMVAGITRDMDFVAARTNRPMYWSRETQFPYVPRFRDFMNERLKDSLAAIVSPVPGVVIDWAQRRDVSFLLVDASLFDPASKQPWWYTVLPVTKGPIVPARPQWGQAWLARQSACRQVENGVWLFDVACLAARQARPERQVAFFDR